MTAGTPNRTKGPTGTFRKTTQDNARRIGMPKARAWYAVSIRFMLSPTLPPEDQNPILSAHHRTLPGPLSL
jgi:hypothetical protein